MLRKMWLIAVIFLGLLGSRMKAQAKARLSFTDLKYNILDSSLLQHFDCSLAPANYKPRGINVYFQTTREVKNASVIFSFDISRANKYERYLSTSVDICKALSAVHQNVLIRLIFDELKRVGNLPKACPLQNRSIWVKNYFIDPKNVPFFLPDIVWRTTTEVFVEGKNAFNVVVLGRIKRIK